RRRLDRSNASGSFSMPAGTVAGKSSALARAPQRREDLGHLVPADPQQEGVVAPVGLAAQDVEAGLRIGEGFDAVRGLLEAVAGGGAEQRRRQLDRTAGGIALVHLQLAIDLVVAH